MKELELESEDCPGVDLTDALADVRVMREVLAQGGGDVRNTNPEMVLRALRLVDSISDGSRLTSYLVQLLRHPSPQVRSKATLLLGHANLNINRVRGFLLSSDTRLRANAVESLWGHAGRENVRQLLWEASRDRNNRVMVNALLGLCKAGDRGAFARLAALSDSPNPRVRSGAAWAMGETGDAAFAATIEKLAQDTDEGVAGIAARARKKLGGDGA
ncbi:MAG TPA: HEAT repeat domain-containing protein [Bryobacteraceae bacterium]